MIRMPLLVLLVSVQAICALFFISDLLSSLVGWRSAPVSWRVREMLEIGAAVGLLLGVIAGSVAVFRSQQRTRRAEESLRVASGAFMDVIAERFDAWKLTPAERDVALFSIKGLSIAEIANLRETSEGTVKAQSAAIYRKAGVSSRMQLLSLFVEDLLDGELVTK